MLCCGSDSPQGASGALTPGPATWALAAHNAEPSERGSAPEPAGTGHNTHEITISADLEPTNNTCNSYSCQPPCH